MRTGNPALSDNVFTSAVRTGADRMTVSGAVNKTGILLILLFAAAYYSWNVSLPNGGRAIASNPWIIVGGLGGLITALITIFVKKAAPITAPIYAIFEGLLLGGISAQFEVRFPGIATQAIMGTMGTLAALLMAYRFGIIRATENFKLGVFAATVGIFIVYMITMVLGLFGKSVPYIHQSGTIGIVFSLFVVVIAALNLVLDFDFIENGEASGAPKYMEWYAAFGLLVTLVWLYLELLRLLSKLRSSN